MTNTSGNVIALRPDGDSIRIARGQFIHGLLRDERWSLRQAAMKMGMTHSVLASRAKGETPFLADELEQIALLLRIDPVTFYAKYLKVGPGGLEPPTSTVEYGRFATVTPIRSAA